MIKILHLQTTLDLSCGVTRTISELTKNLSDEFEQYVLCLGGNGIERFKQFNFNPVVLGIKNHSFVSPLKIFPSIISFCKRNKIDIIHSHHRYFDFLAYPISKILNIKTVTSVHSKVFDKKKHSYKSERLIACSNDIKNHLINCYGINEKRISIIYNMVNPKEMKITKTISGIFNENNQNLGKFIIGYFGRLDYKEKGIDVLLEAINSTMEIKNNTLLLLIGDGINKSEIEKFTKKNQLNMIMIESLKDIYNYFQLLDAFVLPSRIDPFPLTMLETGIMKVPFIGSNVDGISELIEHKKNGLLFEKENVNDLATQVMKIMSDKSYAAILSENLYNKVIKDYTTDKIIPQYEKLYYELYNV